MAKSSSARPLVLGGLALAAAAAGALKNRHRLPGPFGRSGAGVTEPAPLPAPAEAEPGQAATTAGAAAPPAVSNFDAAGPPANTATHVPAPEPLVHPEGGGIDEAAEEAAAAAEAANIGGGVPDYPDTELGELADEEMRPVVEAGEGEAEGQEIGEFDLKDNLEPAAGDPLEGGRRIEDVIEAQDDPLAGEQPFDDQSSHGSPRAEAEQSAVGTTEPLQSPPPGSDPHAPGAMGETLEGASPTPPNPGATTTDASAAQFSAGGGGEGDPVAEPTEPGGLGGAQQAIADQPTELLPAVDAPTQAMPAADLPGGDAAASEPRSIPDTASVDPTDPGVQPPAPDARVADVPAPGTPPEQPDQTLAPGTVDEGAPSAGGSLSGAAASPDERPAADEQKAEGGDDGSEWQTWSGRAVEP